LVFCLLGAIQFLGVGGVGSCINRWQKFTGGGNVLQDQILKIYLIVVKC